MDSQLSQLPKVKEDILTMPEKRREENLQIKDIFEKFSRESLQIIKESCNLAKSKRKSSVTPWHILNILAKKDVLTSKINTDSLKIILDKTEKVFAEDKNLDYSGLVFFSPEVRKILIASYLISKQQFSDTVSGIHLVLALSVYPEMQDVFTSINFLPDSFSGYFLPKTVEEYSTDLTNVITTTKKSYTNREKELENIVRILVREDKHNVVLLGEEGVGKSIIGLGLADFLIKNKFPNFTDVRVVSLDLGRLFSLSSLTESNIQKIVEEVSSMGKTIFFLENANLLSSSLQISQLIDFLQNLEKKGSVYFVLSVTPSFFKEYISVNPYFSSFFETIKVEELASDITEEVLKAEAPRIEKFYGLKIEDSVFKESTSLAKRYLSGSMPQKAISLLEEVCASVSLKKGESITVDDVRQIVSQKTGIPLNSLTESETEKLNNLENLLGQYVVGQTEAISKVSESLKRARAGLKDPKKPIGSFLFLGPTGVGKTELAKTLAKLFFNDEKSFLRFDMSEYAESHTAQRLIGSPPGYVGYGEGGQLTNKIIEKPYSLILFDEIEKANPRIFDLFLQILDEGRLSDSQGRVVDFRNTLIIFTSNIASQEIFSQGSNLIDPKFDRKTFFDGTIMPIVREYFRPEFINRFDDIIMFNPLQKNELFEIAKIKIGQVKERIKDKNINFEISDDKLKELVESSYDPSFGARPLERAIKDKIENTVAKKIISGEVKEGDTIKW